MGMMFHSSFVSSGRLARSPFSSSGPKLDNFGESPSLRAVPNPKTVQIESIHWIEGSRALIVTAYYPDVPTTEKRKVLVVSGCGLKDFIDHVHQHGLDPHFAGERPFRLVARFFPNEEGQRLARIVAEAVRT